MAGAKKKLFYAFPPQKTVKSSSNGRARQGMEYCQNIETWIGIEETPSSDTHEIP